MESSFWKVGNKYFVRTVTHYTVGQLKAIEGDELIFDHATWIADTSRYHQFIVNGTVGEAEPYPPDMDVLINRTSIIDACPWLHSLALKQNVK